MSWSVIAGAVLQGLGSRAEGKRNEKQNRQSRQHDARMLDYKYKLDDYYRRKERSEKAKGWDNFYTDNKPGRDPGPMPSLQDVLKDIK